MSIKIQPLFKKLIKLKTTYRLIKKIETIYIFKVITISKN